MRRNLEQQQSRAAADFEHTPRLQLENARERRVAPFAHLFRRNWLICVTAVPSRDIEEWLSRLVTSIGVVVKRLPLLDVLLFELLYTLTFGARNDVGHQTFLVRAI